MTRIDIPNIVAALSDFYTPEEIDIWLDRPHPQLNGRSATALIAEGRADDVMAVIDRLREGVYL